MIYFVIENCKYNYVSIEKQSDMGLHLFEPRHEKTCFLHMQNQRRRSAGQ